MPATTAGAPADAAEAWPLVLAAHRFSCAGRLPPHETRFVLAPGGALERAEGDGAPHALAWEPGRGWRHPGTASPAASGMLDLYLPLCTVRALTGSLTIGHLGQSLDGHIAMDSGDSCFVTGPQNIMHMHRLRALSDAVVVGAETVAKDDPRLTTRQVDGSDAVRVVLDPGRRLDPGHRIFCDGEAATIVLCARELAAGAGHRVGQAEVIGIRAHEGRLDLAAALAVLRERALATIFVEGGGITVSAMLAGGLLDRLQVTIAPLIIGGGRPGLRLPAPPSLAECIRPPARIFRMGEDVLFDCDLRGSGDAGAGGASIGPL